MRPVYPAKAGNARTTIAEKTYHLKTHLMPAFGDKPMTLETFSPKALDTFAANMAKKVGVGRHARRGAARPSIALTDARSPVMVLSMFRPTPIPMAMPMRSSARGAAVVCLG